MDEIANLIRMLAESFELPEGTIPTAAESYDRQQVEDAAAIQENEKPGEAEPAVEVAGNAGQGPADPEAVQQNTNAPVSPEAAVHQPVPASTPEGVTAGERYEVKPLSVVRSEGVPASEAVRVYDGQRVLAAVASANLNERVQAASPEVLRSDTFDVQQVTPATTVVHAVPSSLPFDFGHAMATIDRDVDLPEIGSSSQPNDIEIPDLFSADTSEAYTAASYSGESVLQNQRDVLS